MGLLVLSHYNNILGLNPIFYIFQQRTTAVLNFVKGTAINPYPANVKNMVSSE